MRTYYDDDGDEVGRRLTDPQQAQILCLLRVQLLSPLV
jgi:hypothetical protein